MTPFEQWLSDATRGLSADSAAQVRAEIQQHYDSACEAGGDAIAELGDPRAANRAYREVLLTEREARMAPGLTRPKRPSLLKTLYDSTKLATSIWWLSGKPLWSLAERQYGRGFWPVMIVVFCDISLILFFPLTTLERSRNYFYARVVRGVLVAAMAWWYDGWITALVLGAVIFWAECSSSYQRLSIFHKLRRSRQFCTEPK